MHKKFNDDIFAQFLVIMKNVVISFIKEYRGLTLRPPGDVIDDVIFMKKLFGHNLGRSFHIWGQIEAVFNISKFSKRSHFELATNFFYRKLYRKLNIPERWPLAFPTFWVFVRCSSTNIDGDLSVSKFDLLCGLVTSSTTSWICIYINKVIISWYLCTRSLMMISLLSFLVIMKNVVISFIKEYRGLTLRPPGDVIDDVIFTKKLFWHNLGRSCHIWGQIETVFNISKFSKRSHFELATNFFLPEVITEVEYTRKMAISISDILGFCSML